MTEEYQNCLKGSCHCGNIRFELHTDKTENDFVPRACQCSFCTRHGASWLADPDGNLAIEDTDKAHYYKFGHQTADFVMCSDCGVLTMVLSEIGGCVHAVVNRRAMPDYEFPAAEAPVSFEGETTEQRLARRQKNWIGDVCFFGRDSQDI